MFPEISLRKFFHPGFYMDHGYPGPGQYDDDSDDEQEGASGELGTFEDLSALEDVPTPLSGEAQTYIPTN